MQDCLIQSIRVIGSCQHYHPYIVLKPVELVKKKRPTIVVNHRVEVLENQKTRSRDTRAGKHAAHVLVVSRIFRLEALNVKARLSQLIYESLERVGFTVARRANEQDAAFPGNSVSFINLSRTEELCEVDLDFLFQRFRQDQVVKGGRLDRLESQCGGL